MTNSHAVHVSGLGLVIGAALFVIHILLRSVITAGADTATLAREGAWLMLNAVGLLGAVLVLMGLPALYASISKASGATGLIGVVLISVAWIFFGVFLSFYALLVMPWLAEKAPWLIAPSAPPPVAFVVAFVAALAAWCGGTFMVAIPLLRRIESRWVGYMVAASGVWMVVGDLIIAPRGPAASLAVNILSNLGPVLLLVPLGGVGWREWSRPRDAVKLRS